LFELCEQYENCILISSLIHEYMVTNTLWLVCLYSNLEFYIDVLYIMVSIFIMSIVGNLLKKITDPMTIMIKVTELMA